ncbi:serine/threonine protein kinase [Candidatus Margulisiibacteriota bacterium]
MKNTWQNLQFPKFLDELEPILGFKLTNLCLKRNSYINRVFELEKADTKERIIIKFYRPGRWSREMILSEHKFITKLASHEIAVIPPLSINSKTLFDLNGIPFAVFPKMGGRAIDEFDEETWEQIGRTIGRIHLISQTMTDVKRIIWKPTIATKNHLEILEKENVILPDYKKPINNLLDSFITKTSPLFEKEELILLHGDCHKGNFIYRPNEGIFLVDFDDISIGPAVQDLWMLLPDSPQHAKNEIRWFLKGYETFRPFPVHSLKLVPALRAMRLIHFAAWCALQSNEPEFKDTFPEFGTPRYWNEIIRELQKIVYS